MHLSVDYPPKARQPFPPSLPTLSTVIQSDAFPSAFLLEWTLHHLHKHKLIHTNRRVTHTCPGVCEDSHTWMLTQTDTLTQSYTHILLPVVFSAGIGADTSQYPGAVDPLLCSTTLFSTGCYFAEAKRQSSATLTLSGWNTLKLKVLLFRFFSPKYSRSDQYKEQMHGSSIIFNSHLDYIYMWNKSRPLSILVQYQ